METCSRVVTRPQTQPEPHTQAISSLQIRPNWSGGCAVFVSAGARRPTPCHERTNEIKCCMTIKKHKIAFDLDKNKISPPNPIVEVRKYEVEARRLGVAGGATTNTNHQQHTTKRAGGPVPSFKFEVRVPRTRPAPALSRGEKGKSRKRVVCGVWCVVYVQ